MKSIMIGKIIIVVLASIIILETGILLSIITFQKQPLPQSTNIIPTPYLFKAKVVYISGSAWQTVNDRRIEIKEEDILNQNDEIFTDKDSRLVLSFDDGSVLRIGDQTKILLAELKPKSMIIDEKTGKVFARVNKDTEHRFTITAGSYKIESLGTTFSVEKSDEVKVKVFESQVKVVSQDNSETQVGTQEQWQETKNKVEALNSKEVKNNEFLNWSLNEEITPVPSPTLSPTDSPTIIPTHQAEKPPVSGNLSLSGNKTDHGVKFDWQVSNLDVSGGFKIVKNTSGNPSYPQDSYVFINPSERSYTWEITDGQEWHFRICQYTNSNCVVYSNEIVVKAPTTSSTSNTESGGVKSISLSLEKIGDTKVKLNWSLDGYSRVGFKTAWSTTSGPTYPPRDFDSNQWHYLSSPDTRSDIVEGLSAGKTYYFRACEYLGGKCGVYSNEVSLGL